MSAARVTDEQALEIRAEGEMEEGDSWPDRLVKDLAADLLDARNQRDDLAKVYEVVRAERDALKARPQPGEVDYRAPKPAEVCGTCKGTRRVPCTYPDHNFVMAIGTAGGRSASESQCPGCGYSGESVCIDCEGTPTAASERDRAIVGEVDLKALRDAVESAWEIHGGDPLCLERIDEAFDAALARHIAAVYYPSQASAVGAAGHDDAPA